MNRLTKSIGLVLIASSLGLHGCANEPDDDDRRDNPQNSPSGTSQGWHHYGGSGFVTRTSVTRSVPVSGGFGSLAHPGGSVRGGFGGSAHGGGS